MSGSKTPWRSLAISAVGVVLLIGVIYLAVRSGKNKGGGGGLAGEGEDSSDSPSVSTWEDPYSVPRRKYLHSPHPYSAEEHQSMKLEKMNLDKVLLVHGCQRKLPLSQYKGVTQKQFSEKEIELLKLHQKTNLEMKKVKAAKAKLKPKNSETLSEEEKQALKALDQKLTILLKQDAVVGAEIEVLDLKRELKALKRAAGEPTGWERDVDGNRHHALRHEQSQAEAAHKRGLEYFRDDTSEDDSPKEVHTSHVSRRSGGVTGHSFVDPFFRLSVHLCKAPAKTFVHYYTGDVECVDPSQNAPSGVWHKEVTKKELERFALHLHSKHGCTQISDIAENHKKEVPHTPTDERNPSVAPNSWTDKAKSMVLVNPPSSGFGSISTSSTDTLTTDESFDEASSLAASEAAVASDNSAGPTFGNGTYTPPFDPVNANDRLETQAVALRRGPMTLNITRYPCVNSIASAVFFTKQCKCLCGYNNTSPGPGIPICAVALEPQEGTNVVSKEYNVTGIMGTQGVLTECEDGYYGPLCEKIPFVNQQERGLVPYTNVEVFGDVANYLNKPLESVFKLYETAMFCVGQEVQNMRFLLTETSMVRFFFVKDQASSSAAPGSDEALGHTPMIRFIQKIYTEGGCFTGQADGWGNHALLAGDVVRFTHGNSTERRLVGQYLPVRDSLKIHFGWVTGRDDQYRFQMKDFERSMKEGIDYYYTYDENAKEFKSIVATSENAARTWFYGSGYLNDDFDLVKTFSRTAPPNGAYTNSYFNSTNVMIFFNIYQTSEIGGAMVEVLPALHDAHSHQTDELSVAFENSEVMNFLTSYDSTQTVEMMMSGVERDLAMYNYYSNSIFSRIRKEKISFGLDTDEASPLFEDMSEEVARKVFIKNDSFLKAHLQFNGSSLYNNYTFYMAAKTLMSKLSEGEKTSTPIMMSNGNDGWKTYQYCPTMFPADFSTFYDANGNPKTDEGDEQLLKQSCSYDKNSSKAIGACGKGKSYDTSSTYNVQKIKSIKDTSNNTLEENVFLATSYDTNTFNEASAQVRETMQGTHLNNNMTIGLVQDAHDLAIHMVRFISPTAHAFTIDQTNLHHLNYVLGSSFFADVYAEYLSSYARGQRYTDVSFQNSIKNERIGLEVADLIGMSSLYALSPDEVFYIQNNDYFKENTSEGLGGVYGNIEDISYNYNMTKLNDYYNSSAIKAIQNNTISNINKALGKRQALVIFNAWMKSKVLSQDGDVNLTYIENEINKNMSGVHFSVDALTSTNSNDFDTGLAYLDLTNSIEEGQLGTTIVNIIRNAMADYKDIDKTGSFYNTDIFYQKIAEEASKTFGLSVSGPNSKINRRGEEGEHVYDSLKDLSANTMGQWILTAVVAQTVYAILGVAFNVWYHLDVYYSEEFSEERATYDAMRNMREAMRSLGNGEHMLVRSSMSWFSEMNPSDFVSDIILVQHSGDDVSRGEVQRVGWSDGELKFGFRGVQVYSVQENGIILRNTALRREILGRYGLSREGMFNEYFYQKNDPGTIELWDSTFLKAQTVNRKLATMGKGMWRFFDRGIPRAYLQALKAELATSTGNTRAIDRMTKSLPGDVRAKLERKLVQKGMSADEAKLKVANIMGDALGAIDSKLEANFAKFKKKMNLYQEYFGQDMDVFAKKINLLLDQNPKLHDFREIYTNLVRYQISQNPHMQGIIDNFNEGGIKAFEKFRAEYRKLVEEQGAALELNPNEIQEVMSSIDHIPTQQRKVTLNDFLEENYEESRSEALVERICVDRIRGKIKAELGQEVDFLDGFRKFKMKFHYNKDGLCDRFDLIRNWPPPFDNIEFSRDTFNPRGTKDEPLLGVQEQIRIISQSLFPWEEKVSASCPEVRKLADYSMADSRTMFKDNDIRSLNPQRPLHRQRAVLEFKVSGSNDNYDFNMEKLYSAIESEMKMSLAANALNSAFVLGSVGSMAAITDQLCTRWGENTSHKVLCVLSGLYDVLGVTVSSVVTIRSIYGQKVVREKIYNGDLEDYPKAKLDVRFRLRDDAASTRRVALPNNNFEWPDKSFDTYRAREMRVTAAYSVFTGTMVFLDLGVSIYSLVELLKKQFKADNANAAQARENYAVVTQSTLQAQNLMVQINKAGGVQYFKLKSFYRKSNCGGNQ